jgi:hypothetical protein
VSNRINASSGTSRWQLGEMLHQLGEQAEAATPTFLLQCIVLATGSLRSDRNISDLALQTLGGLIGAKPQKPLLVDLAHLAAYAACAAAGGNCPFYRLRNTGSLQ